jgi:hypothetical protein
MGKMALIENMFHQQSKKISDDHKSESKNETKYSTPPCMRILVVVHISEHLLNVVPVGDTLSFEKLLSLGYLKVFRLEVKPVLLF